MKLHEEVCKTRRARKKRIACIVQACNGSHLLKHVEERRHIQRKSHKLHGKPNIHSQHILLDETVIPPVASYKVAHRYIAFKN